MKSIRRNKSRMIQQAVRPLIESLEKRTMLSVSMNPDTRNVYVDGTAGNDEITLEFLNGDNQNLVVTVNGEQTVLQQPFFKIEVRALGGDDQIEVNSNGLPGMPLVYVWGGAGDDIIAGDTEQDIFDGGPGNDLLIGGTGGDSLSGGAGADTIIGSGVDDLIDGGRGANVINTGSDSTVSVARARATDSVNDGAAAINAPHIVATGETAPDGTVVTPNATISSFTPKGYSPTQIRTAYGFGNLSNQYFTNRGAGVAIATVIAYDYANARADLNHFSQTFGLPLVTANTFQTIYATGRRPVAEKSGGWAEEAALDIQWIHAIAPEATIMLVLTPSASQADMFKGVTKAADLLTQRYGGGVVSMSWGSVGGEPSKAAIAVGEAVFKQDKYKNVTFVASAGDAGNVLCYPATSTYVTSVGGTNLPLSGLGLRTGVESAWSDGGGGVSKNILRPNWQDAVIVNNQPAGKYRANPDLAYDADPATGFAVYDSQGTLGIGWVGGTKGVGGTSAGSPQIAAMVGLVNQLRNAEPPVDALGVAHPFVGRDLNSQIYALAQKNSVRIFRDITTGSTGQAATTGFDTATGWGSPKPSTLVPALAGQSLDGNQWFGEYREGINENPTSGIMVSPFRGDGTAALSPTSLVLSFALERVYSVGSTTMDTVYLARTGNDLHGFASAIVEGPLTQRILNLEFTGVVTFDANGLEHFNGQYWTIDANGVRIDQGTVPEYYGYFSDTPA